MPRSSLERGWILAVGLSWLLSVAAAVSAGFRPPPLRLPAEELLPYPYPVAAVALTALHTLLYALGALAIAGRRSERRALAAAGAAVLAFIAHSALFAFDHPDFEYVPLRYTLLLALVCAARAATIVWQRRRARGGAP